MSKITGTVRRSDLEGGMWLLETKDGEQYQLGGETKALKDGMRAELTGKVQRDQMGIGMSGPMFDVTAVKALDDKK
jgi:hypothetical protein